MIQPLVSIITPCYNSEKYLIRYIENILNQTYDNIQLIFINDGSTDATEKIIKDYTPVLERKGCKVTYQYQENRGLGGAVNTGLKLVEGEFFTWCDSDNFFTDDYVQTKITYFLEHPEYAVVRCDGYTVVDPDIYTPVALMSVGHNDEANPNCFYNMLLCENYHFGCAMVRTKEFDVVNPQREIYESREGQNYQILLPVYYHYKTGYIDKPMFYCVIRNDSISNSAITRGNRALINQLEEYRMIIHKTIEFMNIPDGNECLKLVDEKLDKKAFYYANDEENVDLLRYYYHRLKKTNKITIRMWLRYIGGVNRFCAVILKLARKIKYINQ